jgi:hypothetical protein
MNWKLCGRKRSWQNLRYCPGICLGTRKTDVRIAGFRAEIKTGYSRIRSRSVNHFGVTRNKCESVFRTGELVQRAACLIFMQADCLERNSMVFVTSSCRRKAYTYRFIAVPLHAMEALGGRGGIAPTHSRPRH